MLIRRLLSRIPAVCSCVVGLTLLYAALNKSANPDTTLEAVRFVLSTMPPNPFDARDVVYALVSLEVVLGVGLLLRLTPKVTVAAAIGVITVFTGWLAYLATTDASVPCGCGIEAGWLFPGDARMVALQRNIVLLLMLCLAHPWGVELTRKASSSGLLRRVSLQEATGFQ